MVKEFFCALLFLCGVVAVLAPDARAPDSKIVIADTLESRLIENNVLTPTEVGQTTAQIEQVAVATKQSQKAFDESFNELQSKIDDLEQRIENLAEEDVAEAKKEIANLSMKASGLALTTAMGQIITEQLDTPTASDMTIWYEGEPYKDGDAIPDIIEVNTKREIVEPQVDTSQTVSDRQNIEALTDEKTYTSSEIYFARFIIMAIASGAVWMVTRTILSSFDGLISYSTQKAVAKVVITITVIGPLCLYFDMLWIAISWTLWLIGSLAFDYTSRPRRLSSTREAPLEGLRAETVVNSSYRASGQSPSQVIETMRRSSLEPQGSRGRALEPSIPNTPIRTTNASQRSDDEPSTSRMVTATEKQHRKINLD